MENVTILKKEKKTWKNSNGGFDNIKEEKKMKELLQLILSLARA